MCKYISFIKDNNVVYQKDLMDWLDNILLTAGKISSDPVVTPCKRFEKKGGCTFCNITVMIIHTHFFIKGYAY